MGGRVSGRKMMGGNKRWEGKCCRVWGGWDKGWKNTWWGYEMGG